jgi:hypothetical protein
MRVLFNLLFAMALTVSLSVRAHGQNCHPSVWSNPATGPAQSAAGNDAQLMRYATELDGDHSLDAATVAEQSVGNRARYTVRLEFASGHEQSFTITAPPGGLQPQLLDMSGDNIPNDLVLTSRLLRWPLAVLLNDGHDSLTVAVWPGQLATDDDRASGERGAYRASALVSRRLRLLRVAAARRTLSAETHPRLRPSFQPLPVQCTVHASDFGRAPPARLVQS